jgi:hypothetical protein
MVVEGWVAFRPRVYRFVTRFWSEEQHNLLGAKFAAFERRWLESSFFSF